MERSWPTVGMRISQWQWLRSSFERPNFSLPKTSATGAAGSDPQHQPRAVLQTADGVLQLAMSHAGGADHQAAIGHRVGQAGEFLGFLQQRRGAHGGPRFAEGHIVGIDHAQARKAEIGHGARGGADIERIARRNQDDAQIVLPVGGDASMVA